MQANKVSSSFGVPQPAPSKPIKLPCSGVRSEYQNAGDKSLLQLDLQSIWTSPARTLINCARQLKGS